MTITLQIGNTDNKLAQQEWSDFVRNVDLAVRNNTRYIYFFGAPPNYEKWQNAAWVFELRNESEFDFLKLCIKKIREDYKQDSVAWTEGKTQFI